jgi:hypothetical protein
MFGWRVKAKAAGGSHNLVSTRGLCTEVQTNTRSERPVSCYHIRCFCWRLGAVISCTLESASVESRGSGEADDLRFSFDGPSAPCNPMQASRLPDGQFRYRAQCALHASQTELTAASLTEAMLGLTSTKNFYLSLLQLQAKAKLRDVGMILK